MSAGITRRAALAATVVAPAVAMVAVERAFQDHRDTYLDPMLPMYKRWWEILAQCEDDPTDAILADALLDRRLDLECRIVATPPTTLPGLIVKARVAGRISADNSSEGELPLDDSPMLRSICKDIERLSGGVA